MELLKIFKQICFIQFSQDTAGKKFEDYVRDIMKSEVVHWFNSSFSNYYYVDDNEITL